MNFMKDLTETLVIGFGAVAMVFLYLLVKPDAAPIWPAWVIGAVCLIAFTHSVEKQNKEQKDREEKQHKEQLDREERIAKEMHETEVRLRIEAEERHRQQQPQQWLTSE